MTALDASIARHPAGKRRIPDPIDTAVAFDVPAFDAVAFNARYGPPTTQPVYATFHTQPRERLSVPISTWVSLGLIILALAL
ncbi:hypothetical protein [Rhodococcus opacus]|uniref:hypothetical protein n=1 Tax=Rhodococcus opacus TaxID=37919 RepID=UPI002236B56F|nr:hypothetical protein [Rhodococcus opacus]UZG58021.1 hypothetical protein ONE62_12245 [Rhodococcus opacus]